MTNYPIGSKIILRSNEDEPYQIGFIEDYVAITKSQSMIPVANVNGKTFFVFSIMRHYSKTLCNILDKLTPDEQWNVLAEFNIREEEPVEAKQKALVFGTPLPFESRCDKCKYFDKEDLCVGCYDYSKFKAMFR